MGISIQALAGAWVCGALFESVHGSYSWEKAGCGSCENGLMSRPGCGLGIDTGMVGE